MEHLEENLKTRKGFQEQKTPVEQWTKKEQKFSRMIWKVRMRRWKIRNNLNNQKEKEN